MFNPAYALVAAVIWAFSPIYYRGFLVKFDVISFNLLRNLLATSALLVPLAYYGFGEGAGLGYAFLSGVVTLSIGDSMFLLAIRASGASVAAPVVYTYVLMIQLVGASLGQSVPAANFMAAAMVVGGVFLLSKGGGGKPRGKGIGFAILAGLAWTGGQELIQQATNAGGDVLAVTFTRNAAAALALGAAFLVTRKSRHWPSGLPLKEYAFMALFILSDLVVGSLLFIYSIATTGVALTVILTSLSPLLTQILSRALGKESPSPRDYLGGLLIVAALVLVISY